MTSHFSRFCCRLLLLTGVSGILFWPTIANTESPANHLPPIVGHSIFSIDFEGVTDDHQLRSLIEIKPGEQLTLDELTRSVKRLYALGRFADVSVRARMSGETVALTFQLTNQVTLHELRFKSFTSGDDEVKQEIQRSITIGQAVDEQFLEQLQQRCKNAWEQKGYAEAKCETTVQPLQKTKTTEAIVLLSMTAGPPQQVVAVHFVGSSRITSEWLQREILLKKGTMFSEKKLKDDTIRLRVAFYKRGFLSATVRSETMIANNEVTITYTFDLHHRFRLHILGNHIFSDETILSDLNLNSEDRLNWGSMEDWRRRVLSRYHHAGYALTQVELKTIDNNPTSLTHVILVIHEDKFFRVDALRFSGATFFSQRALEETVHNTLDDNLHEGLLSGATDRRATRALLDGGDGVSKPLKINGEAIHEAFTRVNTHDIFDPEIYLSATDTLKKIYIAQGFTDPQITLQKPTFDHQNQTIKVTFDVIEGPRTFIKKIAFTSHHALSYDALLTLTRLHVNDPYVDTSVEDARLAIEKAYHQLGYYYVQVDADTKFSQNKADANIELMIDEGPQVVIDHVIIQGHTNTQETVISEHLELKPNEAYTEEKAQTSRNNLLQLDVFDAASITLSDPDVPSKHKDLLVHVLERRPLSIEVSAGVSSAQGVRGSIEVTHRNLFGRALVGSLRVQANLQLFFTPIFYDQYADILKKRYEKFHFFSEALEHLIRLSLRTPQTLSLPGRPDFYTEGIVERRNALSYSTDTYSLLFGTNLLLAKPLLLTFESGVSANNLRCFSTASDCLIFNASGVQQRLLEGFFINAKLLSPRLVLDFRDNPRNPRKGVLARLQTDFVTGIQVQDASHPLQLYDWIKVEAAITGYIPVFKRSSFALSLRGGNIFSLKNDAVVREQLNERFYLGGQNTLRGFVEQSVIPEDAHIADSCDIQCRGKTDQNTCLNRCATAQKNDPNLVTRLPSSDGKSFQPPLPPGGGFYVLAKGEFRFPLYEPFWVATFVDVGNLYFLARDDIRPFNLRVGIGFGIRARVQGIGDIALDLGFNVNPQLGLGERIVQIPYLYFGIF